LTTETTPYSLEAWTEVAPQWQALAESCAPVPLFVGVDWVGTWLEIFGPSLQPRLWTCRSGGELVAACVLVERRESRGPVPVRCVYLNTAGEDPGEDVCAEYNQVLVRPGHEDRAARWLGEQLAGRGADELVATGVHAEGLDLLRRALPGWREEVRWSEDPYVDLAGLRRQGADYRGAALSRNSRAQVNRSLKAYAAEGELRTEIAGDRARRLDLLEELIELHQAAWRDRGHGGAFASERSRLFHRRIVERLGDRGAVQLVRVSAGDETVGVLYSFVDRSRVFFYQSGVRYREGNRFRPGLTAHVCAIEHCLALGLDEYHFLAGDETTPRYKQSLSNGCRELAWASFQRPGIKTSAIQGLKALKRRFETRR